MSSVRCPLAAKLDLPAERKVELCLEWIARVSGNMSFLVPSEIRQRNHLKEWNWAHPLAKRSALMSDEIPVPAMVDGDVPTLPTKEEVDWALQIYYRIFDIEWCLQLSQFDTRSFPAFRRSIRGNSQDLKAIKYERTVTFDAGATFCRLCL